MRYGRTSAITFLSQIGMSIAGFVGTIVLTRTLGADRYGTYVLVLSVLSWVAIAGDAGVNQALRKRLSETESGGYITAAAISKLALYTVVSLGLWIVRPYLQSYLGADLTLVLIALLGARLAVSFVRNTLQGEHRVHLSSVLEPVEWIGRSSVQIVLVVAGFGLAGAFQGYVAAAFLTAAVGIYFVSSRPTFPSLGDFASLKSYAKFSWLNSIKGNAFVSMDTVVLGFFVANGLIAVYEVAWGLASLFALFGIAIATTLFPAMSKRSSEGDHDEIATLLHTSLSYAGLFAIPGLVGSALVGNIVLSIYGPGFPRGYAVLLLLTLARLLYGYQTQFVSTIDATDRPDLTFRVNVLFLVINLTLNILLVRSIGWYGAAIATTVSAAFSLVLSYRYASSIIDVSLPLTEIGKQVAAAGVMAAFVEAARLLVPDTLLFTIPLIGIGAVVYLFALLRLSDEFRSTVRENLPTAVAAYV